MGIKTINEERIFKLLPFFFEHPSGVLTEIIQNAVRAKATKADIRTEGGILTATDNGHGCTNPESLFVLAESDWNDETMENENPAGWGIYFILSISDVVMFHSKFGSITVYCERYLSDKSYRENILDDIRTSDAIEGFRVTAWVKENVVKKLKDNVNNLGYFPVDIWLDSALIKRESLDERYGHWSIHTKYKGNSVYIRLHNSFPKDLEEFKKELITIWYGIKIGKESEYDMSTVINVERGNVLTPVLPYRKEMKCDEKLEELYMFVRNNVVNHCTSMINSYDGSKDGEDKVISCMKVMGHIATGDELDALEWFYHKTHDPYYRDDYTTYTDKVIKKGDKSPIIYVIDSIYAESNGERSELIPEDYMKKYGVELTLEKGTVISAMVLTDCPGWLKTEKRSLRIIMHDPGEERNNNYAWHNARQITLEHISGEKYADLKVFSTIGYGTYNLVCYVEDPLHIEDIKRAIFEQYIFNDDYESDTWYTQWDEFERNIEEDLMVVRNKFRIKELLGGLTIARINPFNVVTITRQGDILNIKTLNDEKEEEEHILKVA